MLPESQDGPTFGFELRIDIFIPIHIRLDLLHPEIFPGLGYLEIHRTHMPEAAVNKNGNFLFCEDYIGFSWEMSAGPYGQWALGYEVEKGTY